MARKLQRNTSEDQLGRLESIFQKLAREHKKKIYGEKKHAKFEGWFYKVDYDLWEKETRKDPEDVEILSFDGDENFSFGNNVKSEDEFKLFLSYNIRRAYFEESMGLLGRLDLELSRRLTERNLWRQADEKNTLVSTSISVPNFDEIYLFLKGHIKYTVENH